MKNRVRIAWAVLSVGVSAAAARADDGPTLRRATEGAFLVGTAVRPEQLADPKTAALIARQFSALTAENAMKPVELQPEPGRFTFGPADAVADFAKTHGLVLFGHTLCWHYQAPKWMFEDAQGRPLPREQGLANLKAHVTGVLTHFKGKCRAWDVVNEALSDDDGQYLRDTPARRSIGDDYVVRAFKFAQAADPDVELYYNDYNIDHGPKLAKAVRLIGELKAAGCRVDAVGSQSHWLIDWPPLAEADKGLAALAATGVKIHVTEMDVDVLPRRDTTADLTDRDATPATPAENPYAAGLPDAVQRRLAERYAGAFKLFKKHKAELVRVTFWGVDDGASWLNDFPVRGRTNHPLLLDRDGRPKPAFDAVIRAMRDE